MTDGLPARLSARSAPAFAIRRWSNARRHFRKDATGRFIFRQLPLLPTHGMAAERDSWPTAAEMTVVQTRNLLVAGKCRAGDADHRLIMQDGALSNARSLTLPRHRSHVCSSRRIGGSGSCGHDRRQQALVRHSRNQAGRWILANERTVRALLDTARD